MPKLIIIFFKWPTKANTYCYNLCFNLLLAYSGTYKLFEAVSISKVGIFEQYHKNI